MTSSLMMLTLITWLQQYLSGKLLNTPLKPCPTSYTILFGRKSLYTTYAYGVASYVPTPWGQSIYVHYLEFSCMGHFPISPIHLFNHYLHQYELIFIVHFGFYYNSSLFCCSNCSRFGHWDLFQLAPMFLWHTPSLFLYTFCPIPRISCFAKEPWFLLLENVCETKIWVVGMLLLEYSFFFF